MSIPLPNLDDRTYDDLVQEGLKLIPTYAPEWTNHNPSDPGITLIELFAYLTEMLNYRLNRVTDANKLAFLKLINGPEWRLEKSLNEEIQDAVIKLRTPDRAVYCSDFEALALASNEDEHVKKTGLRVARAKCIPKRNLTYENRLNPEVKPGHVSVVIVPEEITSDKLADNNINDLIKAVSEYLKPRLLLTTVLHVVQPRYVYIGVHLKIHLKHDALEGDVKMRAEKALKSFLHPLDGGKQGKGWEFGRNVYLSEIYQLLDQVPGVDYVKKIDNQDELTLRNPQNPEQQLEDVENRLLKNDSSQIIGIKLNPEELVSLTKIQLELELDSLFGVT